MFVKKSLTFAFLLVSGLVTAFVYWTNNLSSEISNLENKETLNRLEIEIIEKKESFNRFGNADSFSFEPKVYSNNNVDIIDSFKSSENAKSKLRSEPKAPKEVANTDRFSLAIDTKQEMRLIKMGANPDILIRKKRSIEQDL
jgi:hypothetical protein